MGMQRTIVQEDLDANPIITELGGTIGDIVSLRTPEEVNAPQEDETGVDTQSGQAEEVQA